MGLGSPPRQCLNDGGRQSRRHCSRDPDASIARQFDLDRWHRRHRNAIARRSHQHPSKTIGSCSQIPPPTINQARCHVSLTRHVPYHCAGRKRRRNNRLLLLAAPPTPPLGTGQYLDLRHCTRLLHRCKHRCLHRFLPARSNHKSQDGPRRTVTVHLWMCPSSIAMPVSSRWDLTKGRRGGACRPRLADRARSS